MRILTYDELPARAEPQRIALTQAAFSEVLGRETVRRLRAVSAVPAPYFGLYAVDGDELLGQLMVLRLRYRGPDGDVPVCGLTSVTTRFDQRRRGLAARLIDEAHRREREAGARYALLWTSPGWFAHPLYEKLGYRDVYLPPLAVRELAPRVAAASGRLRPARRNELAKLERLHRDLARDRLGFVDRPRGSLRLGVELDALGLARLRVLEVDGEVVGYALVARGDRQLRCGELVASPEHRASLLRGLEREAAPGVVVLGNTVVEDLRDELRTRRYYVGAGREWRALMAARLDRSGDGPPQPDKLGTNRAGFLCMSLDRF